MVSRRRPAKGRTGVKRQMIIATIALSTVGLSACGSQEHQAKNAGEQVGESIATLQSTVMQRPATYRLEGIESDIEGLKGKLPEDALKQLEAAQARLTDKVTAAENHPDELAAAAQDALQQFAAVTGNTAALNAFKEGVQKGYENASK